MKRSRKISQAFSTENGIFIFSSNANEGFYTYCDELDNIVSRKLSKKKGDLRSISSINLRISYLITIILCVTAIIISLLTHNFLSGTIFILTIANPLSSLLYTILVTNLRQKRLHGAEHMAINCYNKGLPLTIDDLKKCSRFHFNCGTQKLFNKIVSRFLVVILISLYGKQYWLYYVIIFLFLPILLNLIGRILKPLLAIQLLTTKKPSNYELELAIKAVHKFEEFEKSKE